MFIELTSMDNTQVFLKVDTINRIIQTPKGTKLVFSDGESLLVLEPASDIFRELSQMTEPDPTMGMMGVWP